jgi:hypothetical protein
MSHIEEPIFEEEPHTLGDSVDAVGDLSEDEGKSHRPSWSYLSYVYTWGSLELC